MLLHSYKFTLVFPLGCITPAVRWSEDTPRQHPSYRDTTKSVFVGIGNLCVNKADWDGFPHTHSVLATVSLS